MADRVLRDHSEPCGHKTDYPDGFTSMVPYYCGHWIKGEGEWCPGGREVTIDYEAAEAQYYNRQGLDAVLAAAIGVTDE